MFIDVTFYLILANWYSGMIDTNFVDVQTHTHRHSNILKYLLSDTDTLRLVWNIKITRRTTGARGCYFLSSFNNFWMSRAISSYIGLSWYILHYLGLSRTISDYLRLSQTVWTILYYLGLFWTISDYLWLSGTILDYLGLSGTNWH